MVNQLTSADFAAETAQGTTVIDFYADWCGPCQMMAPTVEALSEEYGETVKFFKVDVDKDQELAIKFKIMSIPFIAILKNGEMTASFVGVTARNDREAAIQAARV